MIPHREYLASLPPDTVVPVLARDLLELPIAGASPEGPSAGSLSRADMTVADLAQRYGRSKATCRAWVEAGRFPGAYRLHGNREWRVPPTGLQQFEQAERQRGAGKELASPVRRPGKPVNLSAWRSERTAS